MFYRNIKFCSYVTSSLCEEVINTLNALTHTHAFATFRLYLQTFAFYNISVINVIFNFQVIETMPLRLSGTSANTQSTKLEATRQGRTGADPHHEQETSYPQLRVKLCLQNNQDVCSEYVDAQSKFSL